MRVPYEVIMKDVMGSTVFITTKCPLCGEINEVEVTLDEADEYRRKGNDYHIQDIFPDMIPSEREKLITGFCNDCQKRIF